MPGVTFLGNDGHGVDRIARPEDGFAEEDIEQPCFPSRRQHAGNSGSALSTDATGIIGGRMKRAISRQTQSTAISRGTKVLVAGTRHNRIFD